jgi:flavin reductase (DIM6/NTAB) family NADH-FMN oxidoreductase RutF
MAFVLGLEIVLEKFFHPYKPIVLMIIDPKELSHQKLHGYLLGSVVPRPIAFASTIDAHGNVNLSPFSFFNVFGSNPPILIFSPSRRGRDNTTKHSYENVLEVPEVVINIVNYSIVQQVSLASGEYPKGTNEFIKSGLTPVPSQRVKPPRVGESPVSMECQVKQVIPTGDQGGAGILVICEVVLMHVKEEILDEAGKIDPVKLDAVARMGGDWYCRANGESLFKLPQPGNKIGIGIDLLPEEFRTSTVLTGNDLGILGSIQQLPDKETIHRIQESKEVQEALRGGKENIHKLVKQYVQAGRVIEAWAIILQSEKI